MKVQAFQTNPTFQAKKRRFIDMESHEQLSGILNKMNNEAEYHSGEHYFKSTTTNRLNLYDDKKQEKVELIDTRKFLSKQPEHKQMTSNTLLTVGKTELVIKNKTGEIIDYYKPFFKSWKSVMNSIKQVLLMMNASFYNSDVVKKHRLGVEGFTKKGMEVLQEIKKVK